MWVILSIQYSNIGRPKSLLKNWLFLVVTYCSSEKARRFARTYGLHLHGRRISQTKIPAEAAENPKKYISFEQFCAISALVTYCYRAKSDENSHTSIIFNKHSSLSLLSTKYLRPFQREGRASIYTYIGELKHTLAGGTEPTRT
jgi:hypothetical protein